MQSNGDYDEDSHNTLKTQQDKLIKNNDTFNESSIITV